MNKPASLLDDEETRKFGRVYNMKTALAEKYQKQRAHLSKFAPEERDKQCREDNLTTRKQKEHSN